MRTHASHTSRHPGYLWRDLRPRSRWVHDEGGKTYCVASRNNLGITCVEIHRWSGKLLRQVNYPWDLLDAITPEFRRKLMSDFFRRPDDTTTPVGGQGRNTIPVDLAERSPVLAQYLTADLWPDGKPREHSSLIIFVEGGSFKVCLSDKSTNKSLWCTCRSFDEIPEALECRLTEELVDWRNQRPHGKKR